jgi:hypothetical protein
VPESHEIQNEKYTASPILQNQILTIVWILGRRSLLTSSGLSAQSSAGKRKKGCLFAGISITGQILYMPASQNLTNGGVAKLILSR